MNDGELTGQVRTHITDLEQPRCAVHEHVAAPFLNLRRAALADGFDLVPVSSFRDFSRQLSIWNAKFCSTRCSWIRLAEGLVIPGGLCARAMAAAFSWLFPG